MWQQERNAGLGRGNCGLGGVERAWRTHVGGVVDEDDLVEERRGRAVDDRVHSAQQSAPRLVVEHDHHRRVRHRARARHCFRVRLLRAPARAHQRATVTLILILILTTRPYGRVGTGAMLQTTDCVLSSAPRVHYAFALAFGEAAGAAAGAMRRAHKLLIVYCCVLHVLQLSSRGNRVQWSGSARRAAFEAIEGRATPLPSPALSVSSGDW